MGADIHMVVERKHEGHWIGLHAFPSIRLHRDRNDARDWPYYEAQVRNYDRFARLAAVRGDGPAPRGLPDDISDLGRDLQLGRVHEHLADDQELRRQGTRRLT